MASIEKECKKHGVTIHHRVVDKRAKNGYRYRCKVCMGGYVSTRQRKVKSILVEENGGQCKICGYSRYQGALQFHHIDPSTKNLEMQSGRTVSIARFREEAKKCVLLCANCHAEVEASISECLSI